MLKSIAIGGKTSALMRWAANLERERVCRLAEDWAQVGDIAEGLRQAKDGRLSHEERFEESGDEGTARHQEIAEYLAGKRELPSADPIAWWWKCSLLSSVRIEQPVWNAHHGYSGTIDLVAECPRDGFGVIDFKTGGSTYPEHHLQLAAYVEAARRHADIRWARIVHVPEGAKKAKEIAMGARPKNRATKQARRTLTQAELFDAFLGALHQFRLFVEME